MEDNTQTPPEKIVSIQEQLNLQQEAITKIYISVEKTRKYIFWTTVANIVLFVLPMIIVAIAFPLILNTFTGSLGGLSGEDSTSVNSSSLSVPSLSESLENLKGMGF